MLILLSPAKNINKNITLPPSTPSLSLPRFMKQAQELATCLKSYDIDGFSTLTGVSKTLAELNVTRYADFPHCFNEVSLPPAAFAFNGDVYRFLDIEHFSKEDITRSQARIRILSGLYGLLKPLDKMHPYRLEMGTKLRVNGASTLYEYWGDTIANALLEDMDKAGSSRLLVNLASQEYSKAVLPYVTSLHVVTMHFKEVRNGTLRTIALNAKRARGMAAGWLIRKDIQHSDELNDFSEGGYAFRADLSNDTQRVFVRSGV